VGDGGVVGVRCKGVRQFSKVVLAGACARPGHTMVLITASGRTDLREILRINRYQTTSLVGRPSGGDRGRNGPKAAPEVSFWAFVKTLADGFEAGPGDRERRWRDSQFERREPVRQAQIWPLQIGHEEFGRTRRQIWLTLRGQAVEAPGWFVSPETEDAGCDGSCTG